MDKIFEIFQNHFMAGESIFDSIQEGVVLSDPTKKFVYWNQKARSILVDEPDPVVDPRNWAERYKLFNPESGEYLAYEELPMIKALRGEEFVDYRVLTKNIDHPEGIILSVNGNPLRSGNATVGAITTFRDITKQIQIEELVESERKLYGSILNLLPGIVFIKNLKGEYIFGNKGFLKYVGAHTVVGKRAEDFFDHKTAIKLTHNSELVLKIGEAQIFEEMIVRDKFPASIFRTILFPYRNDRGEIKGVCGVAVDETAEVEIRRLQQNQRDQIAYNSKLAALGIMATEIAHELNTPLGVLKETCSNIENLLGSASAENNLFKDFLEKGKMTIKKMNHIIHSLSNISKNASMEVSSHFTFKEMMDDLKAICSISNGDVNFEFDSNISDNDEVIISANRVRITEVLLNVIAYERELLVMEENPEIKVETESSLDAVNVKILHSGKVLNIESQKSVLEPLFVSNEFASAPGLSMARASLKEFGGDLIYVDKYDGHGFSVRIPIHSRHKLRSQTVKDIQ